MIWTHRTKYFINKNEPLWDQSELQNNFVCMYRESCEALQTLPPWLGSYYMRVVLLTLQNWFLTKSTRDDGDDQKISSRSWSWSWWYRIDDHIFEILINYTHKFRLLVIYRAGSCDEKGEGMGRRVRIRKKCVKRG